MQGKLEKLGRVTDISAEGPSVKAKVMKELDENMNELESEKVRVSGEIQQIESEMVQTMHGIKTLGLVTLELEAELEQSWEIVKRTQADVDDVADKHDVTQENVSAFMSAIEVKIAELLIETGN